MKLEQLDLKLFDGYDSSDGECEIKKAIKFEEE